MFFEYDKKPLNSLEEYPLLNGSKLEVHPSVWKEMLGAFPKSEISRHLCELVKNLPFPLREYSELELREDFKALLAEPVSYEYGDWEAPRQNTKIELSYQGKRVFFHGGNNGLKVSNNFTQLERMCCGWLNQGSPMHEWTHAWSKNHNFTRCLFGILSDEISIKGIEASILYRALKMHTYMASQFKPSVAKALYDFFGAKSVLDFSAGWGDRLVGFLASGAESYVGIDPNTKLHPAYQGIAEWVGTKATHFICSPAEDVDYSTLSYDFVFTSPPYFDTERYSEEDTQSWKRYPTLDSWLKEFLFVVLSRAYEGLSAGGRIAVNIADKKGVEMCRPMIEFMAGLGAIYEGVIGYKMHKRNGVGLEGIFCEPVFIWSKGSNPPEPRWVPDNFFGV